MKKILFYISIIGLLTSCVFSGDKSEKEKDTSSSQTSEITTNKLSFQRKNYYIDVKLEYPQVLINGDTKNEINKGVEEMIQRLKNQYEGNDLAEKKDIVDNYLKDNKVNKNENVAKFTTQLDYQISETPNYFSLLITIYEYGLGAHGNTTRQAFNYSKKLGKLVSLGDVIDLSTSNKEKALSSLLAQKIDTEFCEVPTITKEYELFYINLHELGIAFNDYDLGAYSCGSETIFIENTKLKQANLVKAPSENV